MNKEFIPYDQALELKELGFNDECLLQYSLTYDEDDKTIGVELFNASDCIVTSSRNYPIKAPLYQQAFRFLSGNIINRIQFENDYMEGNFVLQPLVYFDGYIIQVLNVPTSFYINEKGQEAPYYGIPMHIFNEAFPSFAESELACLKKLIKIVKNK